VAKSEIVPGRLGENDYFVRRIGQTERLTNRLADKVKELIHGELVMVAVPARLKLASCVSEITILGAVSSGFEVELNVTV